MSRRSKPRKQHGGKDALPAGVDQRTSRWRDPQRLRFVAQALSLLVLTFAVYFPVLSHPFVDYDDVDYITGNRHIQQGLGLDTFLWALRSTEQANWHPATWISHATDCTLFGLDPAGHHFTSLLLHALNAALFFWLLTTATGRRWPSFVAAALFAVHPINVESVAWAAERKSVLCMFFLLLTLAAYGWYVRRPGVKRYLAVFALFLLALASKPMAVTLPFALLLLDFWPLGRWPKGLEPRGHILTPELVSLVREKLPLLALSAASCVITVVAQNRALKTMDAIVFRARLQNAVFSYAMYLWKAIWPVRLAVFYGHRGLDLPGWQLGLSLAVILLISAGVWLLRSRKYLVTGWLWYLGTLVPMIGLVQAGEQGMADRYAYLPFLGIFVIGVWGAGELADRAQAGVRFRAALVLAVLLGLSLLTQKQLRTWESSLALWSHSVLITPQNYVAENVIGSTLLNQDYEKRGESCSDEAFLHFQRSVSINPQYSLGHLNVGYCRQARGDLQGAIADYSIALENTQNRYLRSRALLNLGAASDAAGDFASSRRYYDDALTLYPNDDELQAAKSQMEADEEISKQIDEVEASLAIHPDAAGYARAGELQLKLGRTRQARESFEKALSLDPASAVSRNALQAMDQQHQ